MLRVQGDNYTEGNFIFLLWYDIVHDKVVIVELFLLCLFELLVEFVVTCWLLFGSTGLDRTPVIEVNLKRSTDGRKNIKKFGRFFFLENSCHD